MSKAQQKEIEECRPRLKELMVRHIASESTNDFFLILASTPSDLHPLDTLEEDVSPSKSFGPFFPVPGSLT
jgi:hypothetical protein